MARQYLVKAVVAEVPEDGRQPSTEVRNPRRARPRGVGVRRRAMFAIKVALTIAVIAVALLHWDGGAGLFLGLLAASLTGLIDGRVSIVAGLIAIAACPLLLIASREAWLQQSTLVNYLATSVGLYSFVNAADNVAVWAYYFLCIGVVALVVRHTVTGREERHAGE